MADWWNDRKADTPVFAQTSVMRLRGDIERMRDLGIELLIVDTPPAITSTISEVVGISDLIVVPTRPSPHDLRSIAWTIDMVERLGKPLVFFVLNAAPSRARITTEAVIALSQHGTIAPSIVHQRSNFASSMTDGRTVLEIARGSRSANEIEELWDYLSERLSRLRLRAAEAPPRAYAFPGA